MNSFWCRFLDVFLIFIHANPWIPPMHTGNGMRCYYVKNNAWLLKNKSTFFCCCWLATCRRTYWGTPWWLNHFTVITLYQQQPNSILTHITFCKHQAPTRPVRDKPEIEVTPSPLLSTFTHINTSNLILENFLLNTLKNFKLTHSSTVVPTKLMRILRKYTWTA